MGYELYIYMYIKKNNYIQKEVIQMPGKLYLSSFSLKIDLKPLLMGLYSVLPNRVLLHLTCTEFPMPRNNTKTPMNHLTQTTSKFAHNKKKEKKKLIDSWNVGVPS